MNYAPRRLVKCLIVSQWPLVLLLFAFLAAGVAEAQVWPGRYLQRRTRTAQPESQQIAGRYAAKLDSLVAACRDWRYERPDTLANPYYISLFASPTLYRSVIDRTLGHVTDSIPKPMLSSSRHAYDVISASDASLMQAYTLYPWLVAHEEAAEGTINVDREIREGTRPDETLTERFTEHSTDDNTAPPPALVFGNDPVHIVVRKPNFWTFKANLAFQFTQNYVSDNWYKGGESQNAILASTVIEANFNNQQRLTFDNKLEMKIGFQTAHNDEQHKFKTNSDLLRMTNKLGLRAVKHWYYTVMLQSWTQFYPGYKANDPKVYSDFMSPFESLLSIGMDYQLTTKNSRFTINATMSPLALKLKYVDRLALSTSFGLDEGHHTMWNYGSNVTVNYTWNIAKNISWAGRIYWFTDYSKTQVEWENTFKLAINRYLSTQLFLYPRFDDSVQREEGESYFQFNELLSLGISVNF